MDSLNSLIEVLSFFVLNRLIWYKKSQFLCAYALLGAWFFAGPALRARLAAWRGDESRRSWPWALGLIGFSLALRVAVNFQYPHDQGVFHMREVFRNYFIEWFLWDGIDSPLYTMLFAVFSLFLEKNSSFIYLVFCLDSAAVALLFLSVRRLTRGNALFLPLAAAAIYSVAVIPFEFWRLGQHHDHVILFFTSLFLFSVIRCLDEPAPAALVFASLAAALFIGASAAEFYILPPILLGLLLYREHYRIDALGFAKRAACLLLAPALASGLIIAKHYASRGTLAINGYSSVQMPTTVNRMFDRDIGAVIAELERRGAPDWMGWCIDFRPGGGKHLPHAFAPSILGDCYVRPVARPQDCASPLTETSWDFSALRGRLAAAGEARLLRVLEEDERLACRKPHLLMGTHPEFNTRIFGEFNRIGRYYLRIVLSHPVRFLRVVLLTNYQVYAVEGAQAMRFFSGFLNTAKIKHILQKPFFLTIYRLYEVFFSLGHAAGLLLPLFVAARRALELRRGRPLSGSLKGERRHLGLVVAASLPVFLHALLYNLIGAENERFFLRSTPYLFVLGNTLLWEQWEHARPSARPNSRTDRGPARRA